MPAPKSLRRQDADAPAAPNVYPNARYGRLVPYRALPPRTGEGTRWICRCDCGRTLIVPARDLHSGAALSCGCLRHTKAVCPACGIAFPVQPGGKTQQFCPACKESHAGQRWGVCAICGKLFPAGRDYRLSTCSKPCASQWKSITLTGRKNHFSARATAERTAHFAAIRDKGVAAAKASPIAGRFETNREAKIWTLIDPSGNEIVVRNLKKWAREHAHLFGKTGSDRDGTNIYSGFSAIAASMRGTKSRVQRPATTYKGWTLKAPPVQPRDE